LQIPEIDTKASVLRLGWGYAITEFLVAPVCLADYLLDRVCSLGALVNCIVSTCDDLLDTGASVEDVLPVHQLTTGGDASPIMKMLREYFNRLRPLLSESESLAFVKRLTRRMFDSEIQTVVGPAPLPYRFWLRKCCFPLVLMAMPAYLTLTPDTSLKRLDYLFWLHRVGRFLGLLDDAFDLGDDMRHEHPNFFSSRSESSSLALMPRVARSASQTLSWWDAHVPPSRRANSRDAFLHTVWGW
jgi:hypothetical protein